MDLEVDATYNQIGRGGGPNATAEKCELVLPEGIMLRRRFCEPLD